MTWSDRRRDGQRLLVRGLLFVALWLVMAGSDPSSWIIGVPTVAFATWASLRLNPDTTAAGRSGMRLLGMLRFAPYFVIQSVRGGLDVAQRVFRPTLRIYPGFQSYRPRLKDPIARVVFLDSISLLPGTLSADMRDGLIRVHALDARGDLQPELARLEAAVAALFGEPLEPSAR
jgi:multicomponent Na+:H+ antiporter subunit E